MEQLDASMAEADEDQTSDGSASEAGYYDMNDYEDDEFLKEVLQKVSRWAVTVGIITCQAVPQMARKGYRRNAVNIEHTLACISLMKRTMR